MSTVREVRTPHQSPCHGALCNETPLRHGGKMERGKERTHSGTEYVKEVMVKIERKMCENQISLPL